MRRPLNWCLSSPPRPPSRRFSRKRRRPQPKHPRSPHLKCHLQNRLRHQKRFSRLRPNPSRRLNLLHHHRSRSHRLRRNPRLPRRHQNQRHQSEDRHREQRLSRPRKRQHLGRHQHLRCQQPLRQLRSSPPPQSWILVGLPRFRAGCHRGRSIPRRHGGAATKGMYRSVSRSIGLAGWWRRRSSTPQAPRY
jgi:hypothetical protein